MDPGSTIESEESSPPKISSKHRKFEFSASSLDDLLAELGPARPIDNITIFNSSHPRSIYVSITRSDAWVSVDGDDEIWVRGRFNSLVDRLNENRRRGANFNPDMGLAVSSLLLLAFLIALRAIGPAHPYWGIVIAPPIAFGAIVALIFRRSRSRISAVDTPKESKISFDKVNGVIGTILLAVTVYLTWILVQKTK